MCGPVLGCVSPDGRGRRARVGRGELCLAAACGVCRACRLLDVHRVEMQRSGGGRGIWGGAGGGNLGSSQLLRTPGGEHGLRGLSPPRAGPHGRSRQWVGELGDGASGFKWRAAPEGRSRAAGSR